jgi:hypothetical protein
MTVGEFAWVGVTVEGEKSEIIGGFSAKDMAKLPHRIRTETNAARNPEISSRRLFMEKSHTLNQVYSNGWYRLKGASAR